MIVTEEISFGKIGFSYMCIPHVTAYCDLCQIHSPGGK